MFELLSVRVMYKFMQTNTIMHSTIINIGVLFTGAGKPVLSGDGQPLMMADGRPRTGRGLSEGTFR